MVGYLAQTDTDTFFWNMFCHLVLLCFGLCVCSNQVGWKNCFKIEQCKIIWMYHIINNIAVSTSYIHQVENYAQIKSNSQFSIQMISFSAFLSVKSTPPFPWLCNLIMSGQDTWIFGADLFCRWGTVDVVAIPLTSLNSIVLNVCPKTYIEPPCRNTSTQNRLSSSFGQQVSSAFLSYPFGQCHYQTNLSQKASL